jgi:hypothetical protein
MTSKSDYIQDYKELKILAKTLAHSLEENKKQVAMLNQVNTNLQIQIEELKAQYAKHLKELNQQIESNKSIWEKYVESLIQFRSRRKVLPIHFLQEAIDLRMTLLNKLFTAEYTSSSVDGRENLFKEQSENELNIIETLLFMLKIMFDDIPSEGLMINRSSIIQDITPILEMLKESRDRLSYIIPENEFISILTDHIIELKTILSLFKSKSSGTDDIDMCMSPYETYLTKSNNYLTTYERNIDIQKRLLTSHILSNKLIPFKEFSEISSAHLWGHIEIILKSILITSYPVNNIIFIPAKDSVAPDNYNFYILQAIRDEKRIWKLDPFLHRLTRDLVHSFKEIFIERFRQFYKDCFGHNNYIADFESKLLAKGYFRWNQMKILYENIQIIMDEFLLGLIIRKVIKNNCTYFPSDIDIIQSCIIPGDILTDIKYVRQRLDKGLPGREEEPEEYIFECFEKANEWSPELTKVNYEKRWKSFST